MNKHNKGIYDPIIEYLDKSVNNGIENDAERWMFASILALLLVLAILALTTTIFHLTVIDSIVAIISTCATTYFIQKCLVPEDGSEDW